MMTKCLINIISCNPHAVGGGCDVDDEEKRRQNLSNMYRSHAR